MAVGIAQPQPDVIDSTIGTLKRCLQMASPIPTSSTCPPKPKIKSPPKEVLAAGDPKAEAGSQWPHCQHMISRDELKGNDRSQTIKLVQYQDESQIKDIMRLITKDLSEPYSIYTYRYFIHNWPQLCLLAYDTVTESYVGAIVCKLDKTIDGRRKGYLAMLAVDESCRRLGLGSRLVRRAIENMTTAGCDEVVLETEVSNKNAQSLYSNMGFIREKRLLRYYLNGGDAFRLKLFFSSPKTAFPED